MRNRVSEYIFDGAYGDLCRKYIDYKKGLGFKSGDSVCLLVRAMDRFFIKYDIDSATPFLTRDMVEDYVAYRGQEASRTQHTRMCLIRQFAIFVNQAFGYDFYVYPLNDFIKVKTNFVPYILTHDEVRRLMEIIDHIPESPRYPQYHIIYPMLFRLLYGCGARINEALSLLMGDINLDSGLIHIKDSKSGCERLLPMSESLTGYSRYYAQRMGFGGDYKGFFFPSYYGGEKCSTPVYCQFKKFMKQAGICRPDGTPPRLHDLRHVFSVHSLEKMVTEGMDIYCSLPILSAYLGHRGIESTEKYLRLTEEAFGQITNPMKEIYQGVIPEVRNGD